MATWRPMPRWWRRSRAPAAGQAGRGAGGGVAGGAGGGGGGGGGAGLRQHHACGRRACCAELPAILRAGEAYGDSDIGRGERVNVEYVSANPTGPLHIGHGRGAVVGDALANLLAGRATR